MSKIKTISLESLNIALMFALVMSGWQLITASMSGSMPNPFFLPTYSLAGFFVLALVIILPLAILGIIVGSIHKAWKPDSIRRFLLTGLIGTTWFVSGILIDLWPFEGVLESFSMRMIAVAGLSALGCYLVSYLGSVGIIHLIENTSKRTSWGFTWSWWLGLSLLALGAQGLYPLLAKSLQGVGIFTVVIYAVFALFISVKLVLKIYDTTERRPSGRYLFIGILLIVCALAGYPWLGKTANGQSADAENPPVILITIDTLRADALTCYPEGIVPRLGTPVLDGLALDGALFEQAYSTAPWTRPSVPSILSGLPPSAHGAFADERGTLAPGATTLAEIFKEKGYATGGVVVNSILGPGSGNEQGFQYYVEEMGRLENDRKFLFQMLSDRFRLTWPDFFTPNTNPFKERDTIRLASDFVKNHNGERFFLWIHLFAPHQVYYPPKEYLDRAIAELGITVDRTDVLRQLDMKSGWPPATEDRLETLLGLYAGEVAFTDDLVGEFIETLKAEGIYDSCIIALSSDHGEEFYEHDIFTHGRSLYPEVLHVPLIVRAPGRIDPGTRIAEPVSLVDLAPTLLDLTNQSARFNSEPAVFTGQSLVPLMKNEVNEIRPVFFERPLNFDQNLKGILYNGFWYVGGDAAVLHPRLYEMDRDPDTWFDVSRDYPEVMSEMKLLLEGYDEMCEQIAGRIGATRTGADTERLKALGYIN